MKTNELTPTESLQIIKSMVAQTRENLERGGGKDFLIWGYTSLVVTAVVYYLIYTTLNPAYSWLWLAIPALGYPIGYFVHKGDKSEKHATTYIDSTIGNIWIVMASICIIAPFAIMFSTNSPNIILPIEALIVSAGVVLTGLTIAFKALTIGGICGILIALAMFLFNNSFYIQIPMFAALFVVIMIIPGHILNCVGKCSRS